MLIVLAVIGFIAFAVIVVVRRLPNPIAPHAKRLADAVARLNEHTPKL